MLFTSFEDDDGHYELIHSDPDVPISEPSSQQSVRSVIGSNNEMTVDDLLTNTFYFGIIGSRPGELMPCKTLEKMKNLKEARKTLKEDWNSKILENRCTSSLTLYFSNAEK